MSNFLGNCLATVILSLILTAGTVNWLMSDDPEKTLLKPTLLKNSEESIDSIDIEYIDNRIQLNVHLVKPISCLQAIDMLRIESFKIKNRDYQPTCSKVNKSLIRIVYEEITIT